MRPAEVLSLIEEASGTSTYLSSKQSAEATIRKKEQKIAEVERVMREDVTPEFERLMEEKAMFDQFKDLSERIEEKTRLYLAYDYNQLKDRVQDTQGSRKELETNIEQYRARIEKLLSDLRRAKLDHE